MSTKKKTTKKARGMPADSGAQVTVEVAAGGFVDIINATTLPGYDRLCDATVTLTAPVTGITQTAPNAPLVVTKKNVDIEFNFAAGSGYRMAGIAFRRNAGSGAINGNANMPKEKIRIYEDENTGASKIHINDAGATSGKPPKIVPSWELYLLIQDGSGNLGLIDPDIQNEF